MRGWGRRRRRTERGATTVEFALVFPLVLLFVFGIIQYGYHFWALETSAAAGREAARRLIVGTDPACTVADAQRKLEAPHLGSSPPVVTYVYDNPTNTPERGVLVTVTVTIQSLHMGLLPLPDGGRIVETATNRVENVPLDALECEDP